MKQLLATHQVRTHRLEPARVPDALRVLECWMGDKRKAAGEADERPCIAALGLANLRRTKRSYQPETLLAKYRVRPLE